MRLHKMLKKIVYILYKSFTLKRFWNILLITISYCLSLSLRKAIVWGYAPIVMIEPTNICNLRCSLCPSGAGTLVRPKGFMTFDLFKKIVDDIHKYSFMLLLWNQGEPFLNSDYCKMIEYANSKGMFLMSSSNVNISTNHEEIISSGLDIMLVSLDGTTQEVYNKYRANGDLSLVLENIRSLVLAKKKLKKSYPLIVTQFLVMKHNEHQIEEFKKLSNDIGADEFVFKTVQIYSKDDIKEFLPSNPKFRRYKISGDDFELKFGLKNRCHRIWFQPVINWDGEIAVCCFFKDNEYKIGNIQEKTFFELWKSDRFMTFRQNILQKRSDYEICRNCGEGVSLQIKKL